MVLLYFDLFLKKKELTDTVIYIEVVLPIPLQQNFTYCISNCKDRQNLLGKRVVVQFGNRKFYSALIKSVLDEAPPFETKPIELILDEQPMVRERQFVFWEWIAKYYLCSEGDVMRAALPPGLKLESRTTVRYNPEWEGIDKLTPSELAALNCIETQQWATVEQLNRLTRRNTVYQTIQKLLIKGAILVEEELARGTKPKTIAHIQLNQDYCSEERLQEAFAQVKNASKQLELLMLLIDELDFFSTHRKQSIPKMDLLKKGGFSDSILNGLIKRGIVKIIPIEVDRLMNVTQETLLEIKLNPYQTHALHEIHRQFIDKQTVLLHGITASGKTEIYIKLIEEQLKIGKQVLYLLPEIALTTQIIERLRKVFGPKVGVYHSKFSDAERTEIWNKVLENGNKENSHYQLILGARSAIFLPFKKLGLIIIDEEHDPSYKQDDPAPRYHARDSAIVLASLHQAKVLLGTATPSFESYFNAKTGKYGLVTLTTRYYEVALPKVIIADMKLAYKRKEMMAFFTPQLLLQIKNALDAGEQVILFQNRRGYSTSLQCYSCGYIPKCRNCDVSLTFHKYQNKLQCHYCGFSAALPDLCPECHSSDIKNLGYGTEKVEDEIKLLFPLAKIDRLDIDSTRNRFGFERILSRFSEQKTDILVGTQMITKGLDFENVSVVGVLNADSLLNYPDFRSFERAYQLMSQVSGRAGRMNKQGTVVIQTFQPEHPVIDRIVHDDFAGFFNRSIEERRLFKYPPLFRIIAITVKHKNNEKVLIMANQLADLLRSVLKDRVLGPEYPAISRLRLYYQQEIRVKYEKSLSPDEVKKIIMVLIEQIRKKENNSAALFSVDVDPY
jgi:primosomal protein N' (replication factor Y) (superfamily II helicase)